LCRITQQMLWKSGVVLSGACPACHHPFSSHIYAGAAGAAVVNPAVRGQASRLPVGGSGSSTESAPSPLRVFNSNKKETLEGGDSLTLRRWEDSNCLKIPAAAAAVAAKAASKPSSQKTSKKSSATQNQLDHNCCQGAAGIPCDCNATFGNLEARGLEFCTICGHSKGQHPRWNAATIGGLRSASGSNGQGGPKGSTSSANPSGSGSDQQQGGGGGTNTHLPPLGGGAQPKARALHPTDDSVDNIQRWLASSEGMGEVPPAFLADSADEGTGEAAHAAQTPSDGSYLVALVKTAEWMEDGPG
jgi:hypothetical protein